MDLVLDGVGIGPWGGIGGHVYLEARGKVWIEAPHVQHAVASTYDSASVNVSVTVGGGASAAAVALQVVYVDPNNKTVGQTHVASRLHLVATVHGARHHAGRLAAAVVAQHPNAAHGIHRDDQ